MNEIEQSAQCLAHRRAPPRDTRPCRLARSACLLTLECDSLRQPGRELLGQWGGGGAARQLPGPAAFQEVFQVVVLINILLFPPQHLSLFFVYKWGFQ